MHVVKGVSISVSKRRMFRFCITLKQSSIWISMGDHADLRRRDNRGVDLIKC
jgi:hypothetical protein